MKKIKKKKSVISVPTASKSLVKSKTKQTLKPRSPIYKENTLAYYNCLINELANSVNNKEKITKMCHNCKHNKGQVKAAQAEHKAQLVQELAKHYKAFGQSLGHYLQADIIGCLEKKK